MHLVMLLLFVSQLPDGPGKAETLKLCSECHEVERVTSQHQNMAGWQETIGKMTALGMTATDAETKAVVGYLAKHFPAEAVPKLNVNTATQIELESALSLRRSQAAAVIAYRTKNGNFKSMDDLKKVPGLDAASLDSRKDRVTF